MKGSIKHKEDPTTKNSKKTTSAIVVVVTATLIAVFALAPVDDVIPKTGGTGFAIGVVVTHG